MSAGYSSRLWKCPFFRWDEVGKIHCEGGVIAMPDRKAQRKFCRDNCASVDGWKRCAVAMALEDYYERTDARPPE